MLHVTIKDTKTNDVVFDSEVCVIAVQAVGREKTSRIRHASEDAEPVDVFLCTSALIQEASEAKKIFLYAREKAFGKTYFETNFDVSDDDAE